MTKEVLVYGGTFDPPTRSHQAIIETALEDGRHDEIWIMPSGSRDDKPGMTANEHRLAMVALLQHEVFGAMPQVVVSDIEMQLPQPTHTAITHRELCRAYPDVSFRYIFGADSYWSMPSWPNGDYLQNTLPMMLVPREGYDVPEETNRVRTLRLQHALGMVSSTTVRERIAARQHVEHQVHPAIMEYIVQHRLYLPAYDTLELCL